MSLYYDDVKMTIDESYIEFVIHEVNSLYIKELVDSLLDTERVRAMQIENDKGGSGSFKVTVRL